MMKRMRGRRLILILTPIALFAIVAGTAWQPQSSGTITRANYDKIDVGTTTFQQVYNLLQSDRMIIGAGGEGEDGWILFAEDEDSPNPQFLPSCEIRIDCDCNGKVRKKWFHYPTVGEVFDRLVNRTRLALGLSID